MQFREVRPGLYERLDTPHHVKLDRAFAERVAREAGSPLLLAVIEEAIEEQERCAELTSARARRWWRWW